MQSRSSGRCAACTVMAVPGGKHYFMEDGGLVYVRGGRGSAGRGAVMDPAVVAAFGSTICIQTIDLCGGVRSQYHT